MTYFNFKRIRGTRSEGVYVGSTLIGRVAVKADWRSRLAMGPSSVDLYRAIGLSGDVLPMWFPSRHDAAEALYAVAYGDSTTDVGGSGHRA